MPMDFVLTDLVGWNIHEKLFISGTTHFVLTLTKVSQVLASELNFGEAQLARISFSESRYNALHQTKKNIESILFVFFKLLEKVKNVI